MQAENQVIVQHGLCCSRIEIYIISDVWTAKDGRQKHRGGELKEKEAEPIP